MGSEMCIRDRIEELLERKEPDTTSSDEDLRPDENALDDDEQAELGLLLDLAREGEDNCEDWPYGETLIRADYFTEYAQDLADDIGAIGDNLDWPLRHIDWEAAAEELKIDYSELDFGNATYYAR